MMTDPICKFWYSEKHYHSLNEGRYVEIEGKLVRFSWASFVDASEPFPDALRLWPDYVPLGIASIATIKELRDAINPEVDLDVYDSSPSVVAKALWSIGCLIVIGGGLFFLIAVAIGVYNYMEESNKIPHREETVISARSDWLVGESKECWSATLNRDGASLLGEEVGYAMSSVSCDDGPEHKMKVTFYGQRVQKKHKVVTWRCIRNAVVFFNDNSFTCYQTSPRE